MTTDTDLPAVLAAIQERPQAMRSQDSWVQLAAAEADNARLLAAVEAAVAALDRHLNWCTDTRGVKICGGCLSDWPCPDLAAISRALTGGTDEH